MPCSVQCLSVPFQLIFSFLCIQPVWFPLPLQSPVPISFHSPYAPTSFKLPSNFPSVLASAIAYPPSVYTIYLPTAPLLLPQFPLPTSSVFTLSHVLASTAQQVLVPLQSSAAFHSSAQPLWSFQLPEIFSPSFLLSVPTPASVTSTSVFNPRYSL